MSHHQSSLIIINHHLSTHFRRFLNFSFSFQIWPGTYADLFPWSLGVFWTPAFFPTFPEQKLQLNCLLNCLLPTELAIECLCFIARPFGSYCRLVMLLDRWMPPVPAGQARATPASRARYPAGAAEAYLSLKDGTSGSTEGPPQDLTHIYIYICIWPCLFCIRHSD